MTQEMITAAKEIQVGDRIQFLEAITGHLAFGLVTNIKPVSSMNGLEFTIQFQNGSIKRLYHHTHEFHIPLATKIPITVEIHPEWR